MTVSRDERQSAVLDWATNCFGFGVATDPIERAKRLLEEAAELAQACGVDSVSAHEILVHVFSRPPGAIPQEIGGVGITLLALCAARNISADVCELGELNRILEAPRDMFKARQRGKALAGIARLPQ